MCGSVLPYFTLVADICKHQTYCAVPVHRSDKRKKLPQWVQTFLTADTLNLSTEGAVHLSRRFLQQIAQPRRFEDDVGHTLLTHEHVARRNVERTGLVAAGTTAPAAAGAPTAAASAAVLGGTSSS